MFSASGIFAIKMIFFSIITPALYFVLINMELNDHKSNLSLGIDLGAFFSELDPYGCVNSPDNLGCKLNRPIDEKRREQKKTN
ncbi:MAG: hypothetical protein F6K36_23965 [Symploca sp. SIO3C6]|uniref:Uncharacterized protein n=1 Tax=Symploca sp. SIO1C4 TaxID=2607765 RepID=A0A6B3N862_9CYAN|nr:hypothetical protein [Symploca sp. SIO3C6]NER29806.1 hypothetical protein [Symploca sp. SIO1C4]NET08012.1 hypothetical protein [Symploca sp. SIO2B6]